MQSANILLASVLVCAFIVESLCYSERFRRQSTQDEDEECHQPPAGKMPGQRPPECCKMPELSSFLLNSSIACQSKLFPRGSGRPSGPPPVGRPPGDHGCFVECIFNSSGLLTKDGKLNKEAITKVVNNVSSTQPDWSSTLTAGVARCFENSVFNGTESQNCKSGSIEFKICLIRQLFLNCPRSLWTSSDECTAIKLRAEKCVHMHIPMATLIKPGQPPQ